jgi:hypothetical protein
VFRVDTCTGITINVNKEITNHSSFRPLQGMRLGVEYIVIKTDEVGTAEEKKEIFECLTHPEALHRIGLRRLGNGDV